MILSSEPSVAASSAQAAALQSGLPLPVGMMRRLVPPLAERSVRWEALSRLHRRHGTADLIRDAATALPRSGPTDARSR
jgi:hypothetical protein